MATPHPIPFALAHGHKALVPVVGVNFTWFDNEIPFDCFDDANLAAGSEFFKRLCDVVADALNRQGRDKPEFWDLMTYVGRVTLPRHVRESRDFEVMTQLLGSLTDGVPDARAVHTMTQLPLAKCIRTRILCNIRGVTNIFDPTNPRTGAVSVPGIPGGDLSTPGLHRMIEVDAGALGLKTGDVDWERMVVLTILAQMYAEIEMYCETGFLRIRRCRRDSCGAWFCAKRMDGRGLFCSATCRVGNSRESARRPAKRRSLRSS